jgi:hypothetical protein
MSHRTLTCRTFPPLVQRFVLGSPQHESKCKHQGSMSTPCSYLDNCLGKPWGHTLWVFSGLSSRTNKRRPDRRNSLHHILVDNFRHRLLDCNRLPLAGHTSFLALRLGVSLSSVQPYNLRWFGTSKTSPIWYSNKSPDMERRGSRNRRGRTCTHTLCLCTRRSLSTPRCTDLCYSRPLQEQKPRDAAA